MISKLLNFLNFRFKIRHTPSRTHCPEIFLDLALWDYHIGQDWPKCTGFVSNLPPPPSPPLSPWYFVENNSRNIEVIDEKRLRKKWPWLRQTIKKGDCSQPHMATPSWPPHSSSLPMILWRKKIRKKHRNWWKKT
jgi:hypothetical protein